MNHHETLQKLLSTIESETVPIPGHPDPKAINDCWRYASELAGELNRKAQKYDEIIAIMDKFYATNEQGEFLEEDNGGLLSIGEAVAYKLGYL